MIVPLMIWSLSSKLEKLEPPHTRKFPRVNAQNSKLGPIQPWDVKDFLRAVGWLRRELLRFFAAILCFFSHRSDLNTLPRSLLERPRMAPRVV